MRTTGGLPQEWELRLVREHQETLEVEEVALDDHARAEFRIAAGERAVLVVMATTPFASDVAVYEYTILPP